MAVSYFMGIDTGTNSSKGVLIDDQGIVVAQYSTSHSMSNPAPGHYEHDAEKDWWGDFCIISRKLLELSGIKADKVKALGTSALGADCLPVDERCRPLRKAILYGIDARATDEIDQLTKMYGDEQIRKWYGRPLCSSDVMPKILWIRNKEPEVYAKTYKFITASTYLTAKLTGNYVVDKFLGLASFNPLYDPKTYRPVEKYCAPICRPDQLAEIHEATDVVGYVTPEAAEETGLKEGTPVLTGTDDSGAEAISVGVVSPGKMMIQIGSSVYMILGTTGLIDDERLWREEFIVPGLCDISAGTNTAGSLTKWYRDTIYPDAMKKEAEEGVDAYQEMMKGVDEIRPGCDGLITLPYWAGERTPINDPQAKGILFGLTLSHTRAHIYRSALEAVAFSINQQLKLMKDHDILIDQIFVTGGGTLNPVWMQIIANVLGISISSPAVNIGASFGDALMAASAISYPGFETYDSLLKYIRPDKTYIPDMEKHEIYKKYQKIYDDLYEANKDLMHRVDELANSRSAAD